jgi:aspartokinase
VIIDAGDALRVTGAMAVEFACEREQAMVSGLVASQGLALCSVVGERLETAPLLARTQAALTGAGIHWLHQSVSADAFSFVLAESQLDSAIRCIHADLLRAWDGEPSPPPERATPGREEGITW